MALLNEDATTPLLFVIYFTKGLGDVVVDELREHVPTAIVREQAERHVVIECTVAAATQAHARLRTADDLRVLLAGPARVSTPTAFAQLCRQAARQAEALLDPALARGARPWSITVSARKPAWRRNGGWDPAPIVAELLHGADFFGKSRARFDLRLQVDGETMHLSGSLGLGPIGGRENQVVARPGALRPSVAAALVRLATEGVEPRVVRLGVYDPFAGSGTVVAEAARGGLAVFASDVDPEAVALTRDRLAKLWGTGSPAAADPAHRVFVHDVLRGFPARVTARIVVGNMPWGKQVRIESRLELCDATAALATVALEHGGSCALLTTDAHLLTSRVRKRLGTLRTTARRLGLLGQNPTIVTARLP